MKIYEGLKGKEEILRGWMSLRTGMEFPIEWIPETGLEVIEDGKTLCYLVVYFEKTCPVAYIAVNAVAVIADPTADSTVVAMLNAIAITVTLRYTDRGDRSGRA